MKRYKWEWEKLDECTQRAKVIGGWLMLHKTTSKNQSSESMVFIPDRDHEHCITPPIVEQKPLTKSVAKDFQVAAQK